MAATTIVLVGALASCGDADPGADATTSPVTVDEIEVNTINAEQFCDEPVASDIADAAVTPTVVLLHGASYRATTWVGTDTLAELCQAGIPALAVDLPGFGDTPDTSLDNVEFIDELVASIGTDVVVVSPSMSGSFSLPWLETIPEAAAGFVAVAPVGVDSFSPPDGLAVPTLVLWGGDDQVIDVSGATTLAAEIEGAEVLIVDDGDHAFYETNPDAFNAALVEFVTTLPTDPTG